MFILVVQIYHFYIIVYFPLSQLFETVRDNSVVNIQFISKCKFYINQINHIWEEQTKFAAHFPFFLLTVKFTEVYSTCTQQWGFLQSIFITMQYCQYREVVTKTNYWKALSLNRYLAKVTRQTYLWNDRTQRSEEEIIQREEEKWRGQPKQTVCQAGTAFLNSTISKGEQGREEEEEEEGDWGATIDCI